MCRGKTNCFYCENSANQKRYVNVIRTDCLKGSEKALPKGQESTSVEQRTAKLHCVTSYFLNTRLPFYIPRGLWKQPSRNSMRTEVTECICWRSSILPVARLETYISCPTLIVSKWCKVHFYFTGALITLNSVQDSITSIKPCSYSSHRKDLPTQTPSWATASIKQNMLTIWRKQRMFETRKAISGVLVGTEAERRWQLEEEEGWEVLNFAPAPNGCFSPLRAFLSGWRSKATEVWW